MSGAAGPPRRPAPVPGRRRGRALLPTVIIAGVLLLVFSIFTGFYTDLLWFQSVDYASVFTTALWTKTVLFVVFGLLMAAAVAVNIVVAWRTRPAYQALIAGQQELDRYRMAIDPVPPLRRARDRGAARADRRRPRVRRVADLPAVAQRRSRSAVKDPQFGMDISFFAFDLPWWRFVLGFALRDGRALR